MDVDEAHAKRIILISVIGVGALTSIAIVRKRHDLPPSRVIAGVFVSGILLSAMAEFQPKIAAGIAALMLSTSAFALSPDAWRGVTQIVGGTKPKPIRESEWKKAHPGAILVPDLGGLGSLGGS